MFVLCGTYFDFVLGYDRPAKHTVWRDVLILAICFACVCGTLGRYLMVPEEVINAREDTVRLQSSWLLIVI